MRLEKSTKRDVVEQLSQRVEQLIAHHRIAMERNEELERQLSNEQDRKKGLQQRVDQLEKELTLSQLTRTLGGQWSSGDGGVDGAEGSGSGELKRVRGYINRLLREVDECIALVSTTVSDDNKGGNNKGSNNKGGNNRK